MKHSIWLGFGALFVACTGQVTEPPQAGSAGSGPGGSAGAASIAGAPSASGAAGAVTSSIGGSSSTPVPGSASGGSPSGAGAAPPSAGTPAGGSMPVAGANAGAAGSRPNVAGASGATAAGAAGQTTAPPVGGAACGTAPPGAAVGSPVENFELLDQQGNQVSLSSYCDKVVYIAAGAMWCPGCVRDAEELEALFQQYKAQGLVTLTLMAENARGRVPSSADLTTWATTYSITTPVLADPEWKVWLRYWPARATPKELLIGRNGIIADLTFPGTRDIERALAAQGN